MINNTITSNTINNGNLNLPINQIVRFCVARPRKIPEYNLLIPLHNIFLFDIILSDNRESIGHVGSEMRMAYFVRQTAPTIALVY